VTAPARAAGLTSPPWTPGCLPGVDCVDDEDIRFGNPTENVDLDGALEEAGMISGYFALLDEKSLNFEVIAFASVGLHSQSEPDLRAFENRVLAWPSVRECYMLSGEIDFLLKCVAPDLSSFQEFIIHELTAAPNVASVKTSLVIRASKHAAGVPTELAAKPGAPARPLERARS